MWYFALAGSAVVPSLLLFWYIHSRDIHPEPSGMLASTFGLGAAVAIPVLVLVAILQGIFGIPEGVWARAAWTAFLHAALPEEGFKFGVLMTFCWYSRHFDEPFDGIVYGATASLGFATLENILYVSQGGLGVALMRAFTAVPGHAFTGVVMGYFIGRARFALRGRAWLAVQGLFWASLLHGLYDIFLMTNTGWAILALPVLIIEVVLGILLIRRMRVDGFIAPRGEAAQGMLFYASYGPRSLPGESSGTVHPPSPGVGAWTGSIAGYNGSGAPSVTVSSPMASPGAPRLDALPPRPWSGVVRLLGGAILASSGAVVTLLGLGAVIYPDPNTDFGPGWLGGIVAVGFVILSGGSLLFGSGLVSRRSLGA